MKTLSFAISLLSGFLMAAGHGQQVRVSMQYIEMPHTVMTELLAGGDTDGATPHDKAFALTKEGKARVVETVIVACRSGEKAEAESIREEIYPTEVEPPQLPCGGSSNSDLESEFPVQQRSYTAFDTRNTGTMLKVEAEVLTDGRFVELQLTSEVVARNRIETMRNYRDKWGDASIRMPIYENWRTTTLLKIRSGQFALVSVIHPLRPQNAPFVDSRILLFVRAEVLETP